MDTYPINGIDIALVRGEEGLDSRHLATPCRPVQWSPAILVLHVHIKSLASNQLFHN